MLNIDEAQTRTQEVITNTAVLNETLLQGAVKATKEVGGFYKRIIEGKPTDHYHITNAFNKILSNNIEAAKQYFRSFRA